MVVLLFNGDIEIIIKGMLVFKFYIDIILDVMKCFGVIVSYDNYEMFYVKGC